MYRRLFREQNVVRRLRTVWEYTTRDYVPAPVARHPQVSVPAATTCF